MTTVVIGICTRERPQMLARCLDALSQLRQPANWRLQLLVVENGPPAGAAEAVAGFAAFPASVVAEPQTGLVPARNRLLSAALETGADWLAMTDDDTLPDPAWLVAYGAAMRAYPEAVAFSGPQRYHFPQTTGGLVPRFEERHWATGAEHRHAVTANAIVARRAFSPDGLGVRFDPAFSLSGSEDTDFFRALTRAGGKLVWVADAVVDEPVPPHRATMGYMLARLWHRERRLHKVYMKHEGALWSYRRLLHRGLRRPLTAVGHGLAALALLPFGRERALEHGRAALRDGAIATGALSAPFLPPPRPYASHDGG